MSPDGGDLRHLMMLILSAVASSLPGREKASDPGRGSRGESLVFARVVRRFRRVTNCDGVRGGLPFVAIFENCIRLLIFGVFDMEVKDCRTLPPDRSRQADRGSHLVESVLLSKCCKARCSLIWYCNKFARVGNRSLETSRTFWEEFYGANSLIAQPGWMGSMASIFSIIL